MNTKTINIPEWFKGTLTINEYNPNNNDYADITYNIQSDGGNKIFVNDSQNFGQGCLGIQPVFIEIKNRDNEILEKYEFFLPMGKRTNRETFNMFLKKMCSMHPIDCQHWIRITKKRLSEEKSIDFIELINS